MKKYLIALCLIVALFACLAAKVAYGHENMFFHLNKSELELDGVPYTAYVIGDREFKKLPRVGRYDGKDVVHVWDDDSGLKADESYLCGSYTDMQKDHAALSNAVMDEEYLVYDPEFGKIVKKRTKKQAWIDAGSLGTNVETRIPHVYAGKGSITD